MSKYTEEDIAHATAGLLDEFNSRDRPDTPPPNAAGRAPRLSALQLSPLSKLLHEQPRETAERNDAARRILRQEAIRDLDRRYQEKALANAERNRKRKEEQRKDASHTSPPHARTAPEWVPTPFSPPIARGSKARSNASSAQSSELRFVKRRDARGQSWVEYYPPAAGLVLTDKIDHDINDILEFTGGKATISIWDGYETFFADFYNCRWTGGTRRPKRDQDRDRLVGILTRRITGFCETYRGGEALTQTLHRAVLNTYLHFFDRAASPTSSEFDLWCFAVCEVGTSPFWWPLREPPVHSLPSLEAALSGKRVKTLAAVKAVAKYAHKQTTSYDAQVLLELDSDSE